MNGNHVASLQSISWSPNKPKQHLMFFSDPAVPQFDCDEGNLFQARAWCLNAPLTKCFAKTISLSGVLVKWWFMLGWSPSQSVPTPSKSWTLQVWFNLRASCCRQCACVYCSGYCVTAKEMELRRRRCEWQERESLNVEYLPCHSIWSKE